MRLDSRHWRRWRRWRRWPHRRRRRRPRWWREKRRPRKLGAAVDAISAQQAVAVLATIRADSVRVEVADLKREADQNQIAGARPHWKKRVLSFGAPLRWGARNSASRQFVPKDPLAPGDTFVLRSTISCPLFPFGASHRPYRYNVAGPTRTANTGSTLQYLNPTGSKQRRGECELAANSRPPLSVNTRPPRPLGDDREECGTVEK